MQITLHSLVCCSYKRPRETHGPSDKTPHDLRSKCPHEIDLYVNRRQPCVPHRETYWKNPFSSSSSSSSSLPSCLAHLPHLDLDYTPECQSPTSTSLEPISDGPPATKAVPKCGPLATEAAPSGGQDSSRNVDDSSKTQDNSQDKSRSIPVLVKQTETPEENEPQPQASIAQILESYHEDDNIVVVRKALAIFMGQAQTPPDTKTEEEMEDTEHTVGQKSQHVDKNTRPKYTQDPSVRGFFIAIDTAIIKVPSESRLCTESDSSYSFTTSETESESLPPTQEDISEEARQLLEYHIKKKMIQGQCGMPTIVAASMKLFHAMASSCPKEPVTSSKQPPKPKPKQAVALTDTRPVSPCSKPVAIATNRIRYVPQRQGYSIFLSIEPEEIKSLAFHASVKMLEIKMRAFPDMVAKSYLIFEIRSRQPLPKVLRFGNKIQRLVHSSLHFLTSEALCILELNITHKCLVITRKLSMLDMKEARRLTFEKSRDLEEDPRFFSEEPCGATVIPEMCPEEPKPGPSAGPETQNQFGTFSFPGLTKTALSSSKPTGAKVNTARWASNKPWHLNIFDFGGLATIFTHPFPSPMDTAMTSGSSSMTMMIPSTSRPGRPEDESTERGSKKFCDPKAVRFQELANLEPDTGLNGLLPMSQESSLSSALVTTMTTNSPIGTEGDPTKGVSNNPQMRCDKEAEIPEPRSGLKECPPVPERQKSSHPSQLVTAKTSTPPNSGPRRPEADARKEMSQRPCTPQDAHLHTATDPESRTTEKASHPKVEERPISPVSQESSQLPGSKISKTYLKYMASSRSSRTARQEPLLTLLPKKPLDTGTKEGSEPCGKGIKTEVGGKGTEMAAGRKRTDAEKGMDSAATTPGIGREEVVPDNCQEEEDGPIKRTSIFLEMELKKENLNLHLKKRLNTNLQPSQHATMEVNIEVDKASTGKKEKVHRPLDAESRGRRRRPFLYVCMPVDNAGSAFKTVCWTLPKWILEMNGNRIPQVAQFEKRCKGPKPRLPSEVSSPQAGKERGQRDFLKSKT